MEQEPGVNPKKEVRKIDLEKRLKEIVKMKIDTQQEISRLKEELERTNRTLATLESEESEIKIKQELGELELAE